MAPGPWCCGRTWMRGCSRSRTLQPPLRARRRKRRKLDGRRICEKKYSVQNQGVTKRLLELIMLHFALLAPLALFGLYPQVIAAQAFPPHRARRGVVITTRP